jgi:hypothetical protein
MNANLSRQLEELQLIKFSLLPGEVLVFLEHCSVWDGLLEKYADDMEAGESKTVKEIPPVTFQVSLESWNVWFEIGFPRDYDGLGLRERNAPSVAVKGEDITRKEQEEWAKVVREKLEEIGETE